MTEQPCPCCGSSTSLSLKDEAGYAKFWFCCHDVEDCGWESRTFRGPSRPESEIDEIGYDRHCERFRAAAYEKAAEIDTSDLPA